MGSDDAAQIVVLIALAQTGRCVEMSQTVDEIEAAALAAYPRPIVTRQPRAHDDEIAHGDLRAHQRIFDAEERQVFLDRNVPRELALVDQHAENSHGHGLRRGGNRVNGLRCERQRSAQVAVAVALGELDSIARDDGHCNAGHPRPLPHGLDERIQPALDEAHREICQSSSRCSFPTCPFTTRTGIATPNGSSSERFARNTPTRALRPKRMMGRSSTTRIWTWVRLRLLIAALMENTGIS